MNTVKIKTARRQLQKRQKHGKQSSGHALNWMRPLPLNDTARRPATTLPAFHIQVTRLWCAIEYSAPVSARFNRPNTQVLLSCTCIGNDVMINNLTKGLQNLVQLVRFIDGSWWLTGIFGRIFGHTPQHSSVIFLLLCYNRTYLENMLHLGDSLREIILQ